MIESDHQRRKRLPPAVYDLGRRLGASPDLQRSVVQLTQVGRMRSGRASRWMSFTAKQTIATRECAFEWRRGPGRWVW